MSEETAMGRVRTNVTELTSILVTAVWLTLLFIGPGNLWLVVMLVGYIGVVPIVAMLAGDEEVEPELGTDSPTEPTTESQRETVRETPLEELRRRYAEGELTDEQFERKVERLLETETLEDAEDRFRRDSGTANRRETELE